MYGLFRILNINFLTLRCENEVKIDICIGLYIYSLLDLCYLNFWMGYNVQNLHFEVIEVCLKWD